MRRPVIQDLAADDVRLERLEQLVEQSGPGRVLAAEQLLGPRPDRVDLLVAQLLERLGVGLAQTSLEVPLHRRLELGVIGLLQVPRLLGADLGQIDDQVDHRLELAVAEHHRRQHGLLGQLLGLGLDHHHRVARAGDDQIEIAALRVCSMVGLRMNSPFA